MPDLKTCAIHTMTFKAWSLAQCCEKFAQAGVGGISVWRNVIETVGIAEATRLCRGSGLKIPALVRGGFFVSRDATARQKSLDDNRACIDEAASIGAEMVVLVCGARTDVPLAQARDQIALGIEAVLPHAAANRVKLAIEPLHPMYAADRSAINRIAEARHICEKLQSPWLGVAVDVFHVWWDPDLEREIDLLGRSGTLFGFHVCDWKADFVDPLNDRGLMGEGCIDIRGIRAMVERAGFRGLNEVEIFSTRHWSRDPDEYLRDVVRAYQQHV
jgi:sugar phosphate isomerase/epimerase